MKKIAKWKIWVFIILVLLVLLRIGYLAAGNIDREYQVSDSVTGTEVAETGGREIEWEFKAEGERLYRLEFLFEGDLREQTEDFVLRLTAEKRLLYQTKLSSKNIKNGEWKQVFVNCPLETGGEYRVALMTEEVKPEGTISVRYGYLGEAATADRVVTASIWMLLLAGMTLFLHYYEKIRDKMQVIFHDIFVGIMSDVVWVTTELVLCLIIIHSSGIVFQESTKMILYLCSVCGALRMETKKKYVDEIAATGGKRLLLYFVYVYAAFALVGQRILIYPLDSGVTLTGLFVFGAALLWFIPIVCSVMYGLMLLGKKTVSHEIGGMKTGLYVGVALFLLLTPAMYHLYANNPGISSYDTRITMTANAHNIRGMYDWHPAFYCMVLRAILTVWDSTYAVILVQYFFWAYVMLELLLYLRKKGVCDGLTLLTAFLCGSNAGNFMHINTIWKDIPYALSLVWLFILLAKLSMDSEEYKKKWYIYLELMVALIGVFFYRKNGIVTFCIVAAALIFVLRRNIKVWCTLGITCLLILLIKYPLYSYYEIETPGRYGIYIGLSQDILGVYYAGGEVSEATMQMINVMTAYNNAEFDYTPTYSRQSYDLDVEPLEFIGNYLDTFFKNPVTMVRAVIAREDALWNIFRGEDAEMGCVNYSGTQDGIGEWNDYYPQRVYTSIYDRVSAATAYTADCQWLSALEWRSGLLTLIGLIAAVFAVMKEGSKKYAVVIAPMIGHILSLLLSTGWSDFRYFWPLNLMNMGIVLLSLVWITHNKESE